MRTHASIFAAAAALLAASITTAHADTLTVGYSNVGLSTGNGLSSSVPALHLAAQADLPDGYDLTASVTHGKREAASYTDAHAAINGNLPLAIGTIQPGLVAGYTRIDYSGSYFHDGPGWRMASGYAGARVGYLYAPTQDVSLHAAFEFGRNFATHYTPRPTIGGLYAAADIGASMRLGPGALIVGARLMNLPISQDSGLHIRAAEYRIGYAMAF
jgi:hypothetical protein